MFTCGSSPRVTRFIGAVGVLCLSLLLELGSWRPALQSPGKVAAPLRLMLTLLPVRVAIAEAQAEESSIAATNGTEQTGNGADQNGERRIRKLEERVKYLESVLEGVIAHQGTGLAGVNNTDSASSTLPTGAEADDLASTASLQAGEGSETAGGSAQGRRVEASGSPPNQGVDAARAEGAAMPAALQTEEDKKDYQELLLVRDNAVTLGRRQVQVSGSLAYLRDNNFLQSDVAFQSDTTLRYGFGKGWEAAATFGGFWSSRTLQTFGDTIVNDTMSLSDMRLQISKTVIRESLAHPGMVVTVGAGIPLGDSPYITDMPSAGRTPADPTRFILSSANYAGRVNAQFYKTYDPVSIFFGIGQDYFYPTEIRGVEIQPAVAWSYNFGFGFNINETSTFGLQLYGSYQDLLMVGGEEISGFTSLPVAMRFTFIQQFGNSYLEPSVSVGLSQDTPDVVVALEYLQNF